MRKIKVALVIAGFAYPDNIGGAELFTDRISKCLAEKGMEVHLIAAGKCKFKSGYCAGFYKHAVWVGSRWYPFGFSYIAFTIVALIQLLKIKPDVCIAVMEHSATPCILYSCIARKPLIIRWAGSDYTAIRYSLLEKSSKTRIKPNLPIKDILLSIFLLTLSKNNVYHIALSHDMLDTLLRCGIRRDRVHLIPNFIDEEFFTVTPSLREFNIIFVGRLDMQKGIDFLFKSFIEVKKEIPEANLFLVGDGPQKQLLMNWGEKLGVLDSMIITGFLPSFKVVEWLQKASVFVLPSRFEGLSNALLQAMAAGLPCVATNVGGTPDILRGNENGILVPYGCDDLLVKALKKVLLNKDLAKWLGENARKSVLHLKIGNIANLYIQLIRKLVA